MRELSGPELGGPSRSGRDPIDGLLEDAGARWRDSQPAPAPIDASIFAVDRGPRFRLASEGRGWSFLAGAAAAVVVFVVAAVVAPWLLPGIGVGGPVSPADSATRYLPEGLDNCPLTKPDPSFTSPDDYQPTQNHGWFGSNRLYTMINDGGEIWGGLPASAIGLTQKTFWWRIGYRPSREPVPQIYVTGKRLDGPGRLGFGPGTNASAEFGSAMLVGIDLPSAGCWQLTAHYGYDTLAIVVFVNG